MCNIDNHYQKRIEQLVEDINYHLQVIDNPESVKIPPSQEVLQEHQDIAEMSAYIVSLIVEELSN
jgi:hypothetical protein